MHLFVKQGPNVMPIVVAIDAISKDPDDLWPRYFGDFVFHELKLEVAEVSEGIAQKILAETLFNHLQQLPPLEKIVFLHTFLHVNQLDLAKLAAILRPLYVCDLIVKDSSLHMKLLEEV